MSIALSPLGIRYPKRAASSWSPSLAAKLARDQQSRPPPPITLPGLPAHADTPVVTPPAAVVTRQLPPCQHNGRVNRDPSELQPEDRAGPYGYLELLRMDEKFSHALQRALKRGRKTPEIACARAGLAPPNSAALRPSRRHQPISKKTA
jgi:hypothetical protein